MYKRIIFIKFFVILILKGISQNDIQISHFMFDKLTNNPVFAGQNPSSVNATLIARQQWVGFETAPYTQVFNFDTYFNNIGGVGLSVINDGLGYERTQNIKLAYAYHFKVTEDAFFSGGIGAGILNKGLEGSKLIYKEQDPIGIYDNINRLNPDFYIGLGFSNKNLNTGISATHVNQFFMEKNFYNVPPHYYFYFSYYIRANEKLDIIPSAHIRTSSIISYYEINSNLLWNERFMLGFSYRWAESVIGLLSFGITKNIKIGYSYDMNVGDVKSQSGGSHEIMISASFQKVKKDQPYKTFRSPRFF